jgi:hypothetical protein
MKVDYKHTYKVYMKWFCGSNCEKDDDDDDDDTDF